MKEEPIQTDKKKLRYLWAYTAANDFYVKWNEKLIERRRALGYDVKGFWLSPPELNHSRWLPFPELDYYWKTGNRALFRMYTELEEACRDRDVLIHYNGANLHPDFVKCLSLYKVFTAGDDPESTEVLSKPVAHGYDLHLINNIACVDMYKSWGLKNVYFQPLGSIYFPEELCDLDEKKILDIRGRDIQAVLICSYSSYRTDKLDFIKNQFPHSFFGGSGWGRGYLSEKDFINVYKRSQIGWNFHNSTGPINFRCYDLPAFGIMQICDQKANLSKIYELGKEVVGFDHIDECVELTRFFIEHPIEQRQIALNGYRRWLKEYTPDAVWEKMSDLIGVHWREGFTESLEPYDVHLHLRQMQMVGLCKSPFLYIQKKMKQWIAFGNLVMNKLKKELTRIMPIDR